MDMGSNYVDTEKSWTYQTTADILTIHTSTPEYYDYGHKQEAKESQELLGNDEALALLETLIDWAETYEGEGTVKKLIEKVNRK